MESERVTQMGVGAYSADSLIAEPSPVTQSALRTAAKIITVPSRL